MDPGTATLGSQQQFVGIPYQSAKANNIFKNVKILPVAQERVNQK